jgi:eukaryotic-like serine/threonine-protein kinase
MTVRAEANKLDLSLDDWRRIDSLCDRFEAAFLAGERPDPTAFLDGMKGATGSVRDHLVRELLSVDLEACRRRGEKPDVAIYRERFPQHREAVEAAFAALDLEKRTLTSAANRGRRDWTGESNGSKLTEFGTDLPPAELNPGALEALRSEGYVVLGELGRGGMGVVYLARKVALNRLCALKMVLTGAHAGSGALARFRAEAETIARLRHPDIVQIYHVGEADGLPYLELEYLAGGGLDQALDGSPRPAGEAARLVEVMARAIAEAHRRGIVHRDLKPANILLDGGGHPKVADFGLAKIVDSDGGLTKSRVVLGSPSYMAPEQAEGDTRQVGATADVYALGAILYELLTGRPPFRAATALETLAQVKDNDPVSPSRFQPGLPGDVETICLKCLEKNPARRYGTALDLAEDLRRFLAREPILAHPARLWERAWKWARRRPALAAALSFSTAAVVLLLVGALYYNTRLRAAVNKAQAAEQAALEQGNLTLKTLNQLVFDVQEKLGKTPATRPLRQALLDQAIAGLDEIAHSTEAAEPSRGRAVAHQLLGDIYREIGRTDDALKQYNFARKLAEGLAAASPRNLAIADCLRQTFAGLGELSLNDGQTGEAVQHLWRVVVLAETTAAIRPNRGQARRAQLEAYFRLGRALSFDNNLKDAEVWFQKMRDLAERWRAEEPGNTQTRGLLATSYRKLGDVKKLTGEPAAARADYMKAIDLGREVVKAEPANTEFKLHLGLALDDLAMTLRRLGQIPEAGPPEQQAEQLFAELAQADPDDLANQLRLIQTRYNRARVEMDLLQTATATALLQSARDGLLQLDRDGKLDGRPREKARLLPQIDAELAACQAVNASPADLQGLLSRPLRQACRLLRIRAGILSTAGEWSDFVTVADAISRMDASEAEELYELGRSLARCVDLLDHGATRPQKALDVQALRLRYRDRALAFLARAIERGLPNERRLSDDAFLIPLRQEPTFRQLTERRGVRAAYSSPTAVRFLRNVS